MKRILLILLLIIPLLFIKIPKYTELNDLIIIEEITIYKINNNYNIILKEIIPIKNEQGITYKYKKYHATNNTIKKTLEEIQNKTNKKIYISKTKKLITNIKNTNNIKKELGIKPNSIIHKNYVSS